jgi:hypothetical protein
MNQEIPRISLRRLILLVALCVSMSSSLVAQGVQTNIVAVTIVGFPPAEIVRLVRTPTISIETALIEIAPGTTILLPSRKTTISPFIIERNYSPLAPTWRQWFNLAGTSQGPRNATIAFLASPGNVVNTLEFVECYPIGHSIGPDASGVLKERLTIQPRWLPQ